MQNESFSTDGPIPVIARGLAVSLLSLPLLLVGNFTAAAEPVSPSQIETATPIKYLVIIFQENTSFDSYFATYPHALNLPGETVFRPRWRVSGSSSVNGLDYTLLNFNPNGSNPFRISPEDSNVCGTDHEYHEQLGARNRGLMNKWLEFGAQGPASANSVQFCSMNADGKWDTDMGYFDGNSVTALWNYAQYFAMSDNSFGTLVGESARGAQVMIRGDVTGALCAPKNPQKNSRIYTSPGDTPLPLCDGPVDNTNTAPPSNTTRGVLVDDVDPYYDVCSGTEDTVAFEGRHIGDLLNDADIPWGWFHGGFTLSEDGTCSSSHRQVAWDALTGKTSEEQIDYLPHYNPFQYFQRSANPKHTAPASLDEVGYDGVANHLYDTSWFWESVAAEKLPAVTFLKPANYQSGHPGNSNPLDEQVWIVNVLNALQGMPQWKQMLVIIAFDDSDNGYDHVMPPIINQSNTSAQQGTNLCGDSTDGAGTRCAYGPRLPLLAISPYSRRGFVSSALTDQTSVLRFIEDNWLGAERISADSFDNKAGSIEDMLDFSAYKQRRVMRRPWKLILNPDNGRRRSFRRSR